MAHNTLTGTIIAPNYFGPGYGVQGDNILSGNLSTSDGAAVINVPRVSNATNNSILTNVGGDANTLTCESNLTFDGSTLNIVGDLTASVGLSASFLYGDGRYLINITASSGGSGAGIFTEVNGTQAFTTSSIGIGSNTTPTHTLSVAGTAFVSGGMIHKRKQISSTYTASTTDYYLGINSTSGIVAVRLPSAATLADGQTYMIKDEGGAASTNNITIFASGSQTIDGSNSVVLESPYSALGVYCNGVDKFFVF